MIVCYIGLEQFNVNECSHDSWNNWSFSKLDGENVTQIFAYIIYICRMQIVLKYDTHFIIFLFFRGRTQYFLLILFATNYTFNANCIGAYGSQGDGSITYYTDFGRCLLQNRLHLSETKVIIACILSFHTILRVAQYFLYGITKEGFPLDSIITREGHFQWQIIPGKKDNRKCVRWTDIPLEVVVKFHSHDYRERLQ